MESTSGHVFWLFGLSGAGKSTLSIALQRALNETPGTAALLLDGDRLREGLCRGLGFSDLDRTENLRRAAEVARLGVESGLVVIAAFITPLETQRRMVESIVGRDSISLVYLAAALDVCRRRDVKGLYGRAAAGGVEKMTGVSSTFDAAQACDLRIETGAESIEGSTGKLVEFARGRLGKRRRVSG
ncbi:MAG: adenylylsulfate kinase [Verrucomicrobia bacterium]|nr:adenylylsulfate kinase [Verrucomicrobiota bacterium]